MYSRIPYLNNDWSSWAIHRFFLRCLLYYTVVWLGASPSVPLTECMKEKLKELNGITDGEVLSALKALEELSILRKMGDKQLNIWVKLTTTDTHKTFCKQALVDSGSTSSCISWKFIKENNLDTIQLPFPITCYNADGTTNKSNSVIEVIRMNMTIGDH